MIGDEVDDNTHGTLVNGIHKGLKVFEVAEMLVDLTHKLIQVSDSKQI